MRIRQVDAINNGDVLTEAIMNEQKNVIIPAGTVLKVDYIPLIKSLGVDTVMIDDPYENYENTHTIIPKESFDQYVAKVQALMEKHIYQNGGAGLHEFEIIANELVKEVNNINVNTLIDIKERSANLYEHTVMVTILSLLVAKRLQLDKNKRYNIAVGCLLHDIGLRYITVPYKNRDMTEGDPASVFEYKKHTILGYSAMEQESWIPNISRKMILAHHENGQGTGFPMRQKCKEIECKIIQVCDKFDCMISGVEEKRTSVLDAITYLIENSGEVYEQKVVDLLMNLVAKYPTGTTVVTTEEKNGVVIEQTKNADKPVIMVLDIDDPSKHLQKMNLLEAMDISILQVV